MGHSGLGGISDEGKQMNESNLDRLSREVEELEAKLGRKPLWQEILAEIDEYVEEQDEDQSVV